MTDRPALLGGKPVRKKPFASHPVIGDVEIRAVGRVLRGGLLSGFLASPNERFLGGPKVRELEQLFRRSFGVRHAVAMNSATSALHAALVAAGVGPGDEVIVPPYTMSASASAILMCGGIPVFADIEPDTFCLDPRAVERRISGKTKAIVVVHLFGQPADMRALLSLAGRRKLKVIEDCAQAPGARYHGKYVGTLGDIGVFSFNQNKTITTGEGGVAVTNDKKAALVMQLVRNHGEVVKDHLPEARGIDCLGWNYRMTDTEAAIGVVQFKKLGKLTAHRVRLARFLSRELSKIEGLKPAVVRRGCTHVYFVLPVRYDAAAFGLSRERFLKALNAEAIPFSGGYVRPIYRDSVYQRKRIFARTHFPFDRISAKNRDNYGKRSCPVTESMHDRDLILTGLCRYPLTIADMKDVVRAVRKIHAHRKELAEDGRSS